MFQFPAFASIVRWIISLQDIGLSHSEIRGSKVICTYPQLITSFIASESQGIRHAPLLTFSLTDNVWSIYTFSFNFTFLRYIMSKIVLSGINNELSAVK